MAWFTADAVEFLSELEQNNDREWFDKNRKRYEASVKKPMVAFAAEMIGRMQVLDPQITTLPNKAVFRIHRDTRFSKDKTPYKTNAGMVISRGEKGDHMTPGLYFHFDARSVGVASGVYMLEPAQVQSMRSHLAANAAEFAKLLDDPEFKKHFGTIVGEKNKVIAPEFREAAVAQPLLYNKQFYYWAELGSDALFRDDLPEVVMAHVKAAQPMNAFLSKGVAAL
jgi:uncharacterized protein (TIGR02453 family)